LSEAALWILIQTALPNLAALRQFHGNGFLQVLRHSNQCQTFRHIAAAPTCSSKGMIALALLLAATRFGN
jgi:hypothetical protein